jgi:hypothetical protein
MSRSPTGDSRRLLAVAAALVAVLTAGCGAVHQDSFNEFADSMRQLRDGADRSLELPGTWARDRFVLESSAASADTIEGLDAVQWLILERDAESVYAWSMVDEPLYVTQKRFRRGVYELNDALAGYGELLSDLANVDLSAVQFEQRARELNDGIGAAAAAMGAPEPDGNVALFSVSTAAMVRQYLNGKKREYLRQALAANQSAIEETSRHIRSALQLTALQLWHEYDEATFDLANPLALGASLKPQERHKRVGGIVDVNDVLIEQLEVLRVLDRSYAALPKANRELYDSLDNPGWSLSAIREIADNGKRLQWLYLELEGD